MLLEIARIVDRPMTRPAALIVQVVVVRYLGHFEVFLTSLTRCLCLQIPGASITTSAITVVAVALRTLLEQCSAIYCLRENSGINNSVLRTAVGDDGDARYRTRSVESV